MPSGIFTLKQQELALGQGAWTNQPPISVNYLVVAGGGGSGKYVSGGGGAGGLLQGSLPITPGTSYTVTVGAGGAGSSTVIGTNGSNSVFGSITSTGGGGGGRGQTTTYSGNTGASGGSGGGGGTDGGAGGGAGQGTSGQGNAGGTGILAAPVYGAGGGGGAGTVGLNGAANFGGRGGAGISSDISGIRTTYAGGGSGGEYGAGGGASVTGGAGGGGQSNPSADGGAGGGNTGGGGGGTGANTYTGGAGGSGIVIISYPGTTQWFTGGTLSYANGNVIHTFYSSGTLAPTAASNYINTDYQIERSLRFNSADSAYLNRTPASAGNRKTWTYSTWIKRTTLGTRQAIFGLDPSNSDTTNFFIEFESGDVLSLDGYSVLWRKTTQVFRDPSAWYHLVVAVDTTQATANDRIKVYVNGSQITAFATTNNPTQNADTGINATSTHYISRTTAGLYADNYQTEINFIDGQALNPYSFGYYNPNTGIWSPLKFVGTYGTNGFYLNFSDNSGTTSTTLGKDYSGNGNNWTPNNFSVTAGAGNDSLVDTPTPYGTDTGAGGEVRGNYNTLNPLDNNGITLANGNLDASSSANSWKTVRGSIGMSSGKWYWEFTSTASDLSDNFWFAGIANAAAVLTTHIGANANGWGFYSLNGNKNYNNVSTSYGNSWQTNDVIGIAFDADAGKIWFAKNGTWQASGNPASGTNEAYSSIPAGTYFPAISPYSGDGSATSGVANFGQRPFAYTAPSGFKALCTQNLPTPTIGATSTTQAGKYFNVVARTFTAATAVITGLGFSPDWLWFKRRNAAASHSLYDRLRGTNARLLSNGTNAEITTTSAELTSFDSDGFTVGSDPGSISINAANGDTGVVWCWRANGAGSSNTAGSITSTVSANTTAGFSIVTWTGNSSNATIGHGLGVAPSMYIIKYRGTTDSWYAYHISTGAGNYLVLNGTDASTPNTNIWQNTAPTSTVFSIGFSNNASTIVAYCFAPVAGYSAFGSYTGNGSTDGPFIYTGFRPRYVLIKRSSAAGESWFIHDTARSPYNVSNLFLAANLDWADTTAAQFDILSNGIKIRESGSGTNTNGATYIYAAFAESPFKYALAR